MIEQNYIWGIIITAILFLCMGRYMGHLQGINKYDDYYYYYINQYPALETINHIQELSNIK